MKKILTLVMLMTGFMSVCGQVGINTTNPASTLDVVATKTDGTTAEGVIAPRLTGDEVKAAGDQYEIAQTGTIVYVTAPPASTDAKTINITLPGYYYFDGNLWQKFVIKPDITTLNTDNGLTIGYNTAGAIGLGGALAKNTSVDMNTHSMSFAGTGNMGVGTSTPNTAALLDLTSTSKGILIPRVSLTATNVWGLDGTATDGMMVYNTNTAITGTNQNGKNFYVWQGGQWQSINTTNSSANGGNMGVMRFVAPTVASGATFTFNVPTTYRSYKINVSGGLMDASWTTFSDEYLVTFANNLMKVSIVQIAGVYSNGTAQTMQSTYDSSIFTLTPTHGLYSISGSTAAVITITNKVSGRESINVLLTDLW